MNATESAGTESAGTGRFDRMLAGLSPAYFALVMATGILAIGLSQMDLRIPSHILLVLALTAYLTLVVLYLLRSVRHFQRVRRDFRDPGVAFGYFTVVAGTDVLAVALLTIGSPLPAVAVVLVALAAALWFVLGYLLPWRAVLARDGESVLSRVNGTWFVWSVASQSLAVALAAVHPMVPQFSVLIGFLAVLTWSTGTVLYVGIAMLVVLRIVHFGLTAKELEPPYWVAMGALAISVVAGVSIVDMPATPMVDAARGFIEGTVVIFWCFAAWLIPPLLGAGLWRHFMHRIPLRYTPALWSMVFPLGMFAVASIRLGRVEALPSIEVVGGWSLAVAALAWLLVAGGLVIHMVRTGTAGAAKFS